jgi:hypothetical protein
VQGKRSVAPPIARKKLAGSSWAPGVALLRIVRLASSHLSAEHLRLHPVTGAGLLPPSGPHGHRPRLIWQGMTQTGELQAQAWQCALAGQARDGSLPSGKDIACQHGRHERWGRLVRLSPARQRGSAPVTSRRHLKAPSHPARDPRYAWRSGCSPLCQMLEPKSMNILY